MNVMEVLQPLEQSILQWDNDCEEKTVDSYDPSLAMNGNCHENGEAYINDQTFHTPSFGDEEFDIPPITLPPTSGSDTNSNDVYGCTQPLSHPQTSSQPDTPQQHMLPPSPPLSQHSPQPPPPCSQTAGQQDRGMVMAAVTSSPTMTSYAEVNRYQGPGSVNNPVEVPQQEMYMVHLGEGGMMPPQSVHFQVQPYNMPPNYSNAHLDHPPRMTHPNHQYRVPSHSMGVHQMHQIQQQQHPQSIMGQSPMFSLQLGPPRQPRPGSVGSSPPGSNHTSPGLETSEDSDDSGHLSLLMGGIKRPSPEPAERPPSGGKPLKRPKTQKKKKKRDPNEPQKPVSAYALFFRDTQAAIKGQNPNASFGEVSKIVASMWDGLDIDHKNVYKRKTEAAKKEYLKALAAYRASLVSKAANEQSDNIYGNSAPGPPVTSSSPMSSSGGPSPLQKKSPLLTSLMEGTSPITSLHNMTQPQPLMLGQGNMTNMSQQHMIPQSMQHNGGPPPSGQMLHQMLSPGSHMVHMMGQHPMANHPAQQHQSQQRQQQPAQMNNMAYTTNMMPSPNQHQLSGQTSQGNMMCSSPQMQNCMRNQNEQQQHQPPPTPEWEREFCNNDCVVSHCRDVYTTWVASRPPAPNSYASVK